MCCGDALRSNLTSTGEAVMSKSQNTLEKRRREYDKKQKAEEKRQRKLKNKSSGLEPAPVAREAERAVE
jgi:hypothetical protein